MCSEEVRDKVASLFCWVELLELSNVAVMLPVGAVVHAEETECKKDEGYEGLRDQSESDPCKELPEIVSARDSLETVNAGYSSGKVLIPASEAFKMKVAQKVHNFRKGEQDHQTLVDIGYAAFWETKCVVPNSISFVLRMQQIEWDQDAKEQPVVAQLFDYISE